MHFTMVSDTASPVYFLTIYKDGKPYGAQHMYMKNGKLGILTPYVDGKKNGIEDWYKPNGKIDFLVTYKDGKKNGVEKHFNEDGSVSKEMTYTNGVLNEGYKGGTGAKGGKATVKKITYPSGKLWEEIPYNAEGEINGLDKKYNEQGVLTEVKAYVNGKQDGFEKMYTDRGKPCCN